MYFVKQKNILEIISFCFFIICTIFISFYHEPWHDEFQAWEISKDSLFNILFVIPHMEGHPPLWHLILKCFSILKIDAELGLKIPNLLFMYAAVWLLIFKSNIQRTIKLILPFTYFLFYQYSIISRPYSIYCFSIFLCACFYKTRNEHPYKFVLSLVLMSLSAAFGMVIAVGICIVWLVQIIQTKPFLIKQFIKDYRFYSIMILFLVCLYIVFTIIPESDIYLDKTFSGIIQKIYVLFILPCDSLFTDFFRFIPNIPKLYVSLYSVIGVVTLMFVLYILKSYKMLLLFLIPYILFVCTSLKYISNHHTGLLTLFFIFIVWCIFDSENKKNEFKLKKISTFLLCFTIFIQLYWNFCACINDYKYNYWYGRDITKFIKNNKLEDKNIMTGYWMIYSLTDKETGIPVEAKDIDVKNIRQILSKYEMRHVIFFNQNFGGLTINTYFNSPVIKNFNLIFPDKSYVIMKLSTKEEQEKNINKLHKIGIPDIFIGNTKQLNFLYDENSIHNAKYTKIYATNFYKIFKANKEYRVVPVYAREEFLNTLKDED